MKKIQVGFLMSYDYEMLRKSIPPVYSLANTIFIALDKDYKTWSGGNFKVDQSFFSGSKNWMLKIRLHFTGTISTIPGLQQWKMKFWSVINLH